MSLRTVSFAAAATLCASIVGGASAAATGAVPASSSPMVFATGLDNPRGLSFDEEGTLYVAEGGLNANIKPLTGTSGEPAGLASKRKPDLD